MLKCLLLKICFLNIYIENIVFPFANLGMRFLYQILVWSLHGMVCPVHGSMHWYGKPWIEGLILQFSLEIFCPIRVQLKIFILQLSLFSSVVVLFCCIGQSDLLCS